MDFKNKLIGPAIYAAVLAGAALSKGNIVMWVVGTGFSLALYYKGKKDKELFEECMTEWYISYQKTQ